ncbi:ExbD/TolR family protein [Govanella unica]|uniref:Biopolymer transporter ExbD n=1 Tax=Govanella unica TaxID=2975056 RepID=A0A9X3TYB1_9PROT|nr:biopolymer transporter ExbD [Govania unica]MDA5194008.1 biopolymer transporter ExbD [Govania unica]
MSSDPLDPNETGGYRPLAEMNVTPLVDVMLVLLIIFMVAAPLLISGVPLELPHTSAAPLPEAKEKIVVSVTRDRALYVGEEAVTWEALADRVQALKSDKTENTIFVRGDTKTDYGTVMELLGVLGKAGFADISLLTEEPQGKPGKL